MNRKILLGFYEVPGYGGASTGTYCMFRKMQEDGLNVSLLNLIDEEDDGFFRYVYGESCGNPKGLENVHNLVFGESLFEPHPGLTEFIQKISPELLVADCYISALLMKRAAPELPLVYMTSSVIQIPAYLAARKKRYGFTIDEFLKRSNNGLITYHYFEKEAVERCDLIITNSNLVRDLMLRIFPLQRTKIYPRVIWRAEWAIRETEDFPDLKRPFEDRDIDLLFVSSSWFRPEKNFPLVRKIVARQKHLHIHIVGEVIQKPSGTVCHGLISSQQELYSLMGRAKALICPSHFDAAPHVIYEASAMGCNIIATKRCGNWMICNPKLIAESSGTNAFLEKISFAVERKLDDNMDHFLESGSYDDLVETLSIFQDNRSNRQKCDVHIPDA